MSNLVFDFQGEDFTTFVDLSGNYWFKGSDVCKILGADKNVARTIKQIVFPEYYDDIATGVGGKAALYLLEPGFYQLALHPKFKSDKARRFQRWVFEEVLPKLRASGYYINPTITSDQFEGLQQEIAQLQQQNNQLTSQLFLNRFKQY